MANDMAADVPSLETYIDQVSAAEEQSGAARLKALEDTLQPSLERIRVAIQDTGLDEGIVQKMRTIVAETASEEREKRSLAFETQYSTAINDALKAAGIDGDAMLKEVLEASGVPVEEFVQGSFLTGRRAIRLIAEQVDSGDPNSGGT